MSYILTALYPATGGDVAASYAAELALALNLPLQIVYPYIVPVAIGEMPMPLLPVEDVRDAANTRLTTVAEKLRQAYPPLSLTADATYGNLADVLEGDEGQPQPLLTVIGNDDDGDSGTWFGSESTDVLRDGGRPVLAVSHNASFRKPQQVCLACDTQSIREGLPLTSLLELQTELAFRITVLHIIGKDDELLSFEGSKLEAQLANVSAGYAEVSVTGDVDEAISAFADTHGIDWLAIAPHHYGFWEGLFHKSHTSRVLHLANVPVLALH